MGPMRLRSASDIQYLIAEGRVHRDAIAGIRGRGAVPVHKMSAGLHDDRNERGGVPDVHERVDHYFRTARRNENVSVTIAPAAGEAGPLDERLKGLLPVDPGKTLNGGEAEERLCKVSNVRDSGS